MQIRYDFIGDKLDLSRFQKRASREIAQMRSLTYHFYVLSYKIEVNIDTPDDCTNHLVGFSIMELQKDEDNEIKSCFTIKVTDDLRFKTFPDLVKYYEPFADTGHFQSASVDETIDILSSFIKIIYKINNLKVFL